jgi:hypothetical protein
MNRAYSMLGYCDYYMNLLDKITFLSGLPTYIVNYVLSIINIDIHK